MVGGRSAAEACGTKPSGVRHPQKNRERPDDRLRACLGCETRRLAKDGRHWARRADRFDVHPTCQRGDRAEPLRILRQRSRMHRKPYVVGSHLPFGLCQRAPGIRGQDIVVPESDTVPTAIRLLHGMASGCNGGAADHLSPGMGRRRHRGHANRADRDTIAGQHGTIDPLRGTTSRG